VRRKLKPLSQTLFEQGVLIELPWSEVKDRGVAAILSPHAP
jgi:hypothetical protein